MMSCLYRLVRRHAEVSGTRAKLSGLSERLALSKYERWKIGIHATSAGTPGAINANKMRQGHATSQADTTPIGRRREETGHTTGEVTRRAEGRAEAFSEEPSPC
jgi:hypothetical protein